MAFLLYNVAGKTLLKNPNGFKLAGNKAGGLIHQCWMDKGQPLNSGWAADADELIAARCGQGCSTKTHRLVIDFDPNSKKRIGLVELLEVKVFTYGIKGKPKTAGWSPMMLVLRDLYYEEFVKELSAEDKRERLGEIRPATPKDTIVEFLYLNGDAKGWNFGRNGMTNAAFLHADARAFFRQYF